MRPWTRPRPPPNEPVRAVVEISLARSRPPGPADGRSALPLPRPHRQRALDLLKPGDTLVVYKPDRVARSMKELLVLLEDQLHGREISLHILTGMCGLHKPNGQTIADKMLFMVAAMAAEMERELIQERTLDGLRAAEAQGRKGGRPFALNADTLAVARARQAKGESVTAIAKYLDIGRSTLYRALEAEISGTAS